MRGETLRGPEWVCDVRQKLADLIEAARRLDRNSRLPGYDALIEEIELRVAAQAAMMAATPKFEGTLGVKLRRPGAALEIADLIGSLDALSDTVTDASGRLVDIRLGADQIDALQDAFEGMAPIEGAAQGPPDGPGDQPSKDAAPWARTKMTRDEADRRVGELLKKNPRRTIRDLAKETGRSTGWISNLPAWKARMEDRRSSAGVKTVQLDAAQHEGFLRNTPAPTQVHEVDPDDDTAVEEPWRRLEEEQKAEEAEEDRRHARWTRAGSPGYGELTDRVHRLKRERG